MPMEKLGDVALGPDPHSYANTDCFTVTHVDLDALVEFESKTISSRTAITLQAVKGGVQTAFFDTNANLQIVKVEPDTCKWEFDQEQEHLGKRLAVTLPAALDAGATSVVTITSVSDPAATCLQWLEPSATAGKKYPFVYTQGQAINCRTIIPCMDTPTVKAPVKFAVSVVEPFVVAGGGIAVGEGPVAVPKADAIQRPSKKEDGTWEFLPASADTRKFVFDQPIPIPIYLLAFGVGALKKHPLGPRTNIWCEDELAEAAVYEFGTTDEYLAAAEEMVGIGKDLEGKEIGVGYLWNTYDILLLPSSFPYGGMENPNLTCINASLIAGDRSLTDVTAHEITHSWAGNLVTNSTWADFWLNEGITMYVERLIIGHLHGEKARHFHALGGWATLKKTQVELMADPEEWRKLRPTLLGMDPDDAFSRIPYEKGCLLFVFIESLLPNGKEDMKVWLRQYFNQFHKKAVTAEQMIEHIQSIHPSLKGKVNWEEWMYSTTLPSLEIFDPLKYLDTELYDVVKGLSDKWTNPESRAATLAAASKEDIAKLTTDQVMTFIDELLESLTGSPSSPIGASDLAAMDKAYEFSSTKNVEILFRWVVLRVTAKDPEVLPAFEAFATKHGRGIYTRTLYNAMITLANDDSVKSVTLADVRKVYNNARPGYHQVIRNMLDSKLHDKE